MIKGHILCWMRWPRKNDVKSIRARQQALSLDGLVERIYSISVVAALPDDEREAFLGRVREAAAPFGDPVVYLYWTEVFVSDRR